MSMAESDHIETGLEEAAAYRAAASTGANSTAARQPGPSAGQSGHISAALKAAESYIRAGWKTFPGRRGGKEPMTGWSWKTRHMALADASTYFDKDQFNVLVVLGSDSGNLTDIDLDWPEAAAAADVILKDFPAFGRSGKPRSHRLARCGDIKSKKYRLPQSLADHAKVVGQPEHMMCVAELRSGGSYTVFPGSEHTTGQKVEWTVADVDHAASMPDIEPHTLLRKVGLSVFVAFCMRFYPAVGTRCDFMMAVAGALARAGCDTEVIQQIVQSIGAFNDDNGDNGSWSVAANSVSNKIDEGEEVTGLPTLIKILGFGDDVLKWCRELLGTARDRDEKNKPAARNGIKFRDVEKLGNPKPTLANAVIAIRALQIEARLDLFHNRTIVSYRGTSKTIRDGLLTDHTVSAVRSLINNTFWIDCGDANTLAALNEIARENAFDPVLDLLTDCQGKWDGVKRLDTWVVDYLGCEDTPLNRAIGRSVLVAACRRARVPGCKFDFITVLEGPEGISKSTAIRILAGDDNFSDQSILGASDKEVQEQLEGTWMHENADLAGMKRADVEQVKAFASRQVDRARPAYGRVREDRPRRSIEWATTNDETYLLSQTGNRRWWPLKTGKVNIDALKGDREQLLGEAATYEAAGESIGLHPNLWSDAREVQEQRRVPDPWEDLVINMPESIIHRSGDGNERVASADVLAVVLQIPRAQQNSAHGQRLAKAMEHAGDWKRNKSGNVSIGGGSPVRGYVRPIFRQNMAQARARVPFDVAKRKCETAMGVDEPPSPPVHTGICEAAMEAATNLTD